MATAEAVIALPVLALILVAIIYAGNTGHRTQRLLADARGCAVYHARRGCRNEQELPAACAAALLPPEQQAWNAEQALIEQAGPGALTEALDLPVLGDVLEQLIGRSIRVRLTDTRPRPLLLGGGKLETAGQSTVLCNTVPAKGDLIDTLFDYYWAKAN